MSPPHTVVLIGAGHVLLYVAAHAKTLIERGGRVVLVDTDGFCYSGLATGILGGIYESAEDREPAGVDGSPWWRVHPGLSRERGCRREAAALGRRR